ncbi:hypothetical protein GCM10010420_04090 [Streptomyces glaucosporus]|uniref:Uncharacterized protein n=1 Tax=Streptomyces glaucosporus TaxID=284044 RepID=A0ABN3HPC1_9ACTN
MTGASTIVEAGHARVDLPRPNRALSRVGVGPVTVRTARTAKAAAALLKEAGLHGHEYAIDATPAGTGTASSRWTGPGCRCSMTRAFRPAPRPGGRAGRAPRARAEAGAPGVASGAESGAESFRLPESP